MCVRMYADMTSTCSCSNLINSGLLVFLEESKFNFQKLLVNIHGHKRNKGHLTNLQVNFSNVLIAKQNVKFGPVK